MNAKPCLNRNQLAVLYGVSDKTFRTMLRRHGLDFGTARLLLPKQIEQIIDAMGHWHNTHPSDRH